MASEGTGQQLEAALVIPEEVTAVLEEIVMTVSTGNAHRPTNTSDISVLHDYAMEHLFGFLPMADLKNCRLVNRSWNRTSNRAILKRKYVIHFDESAGRRYPRNVYRIKDIPKLTQQIRNSFQFPWTKFKVEAHYVTSDKGFQLGNLLRVINPIVTELEIRFLGTLPNLYLGYPNLRKLALMYDWPQQVPAGSHWTSLLRLVERASKLNEIAITTGMRIKTPQFMQILEIPNCRKITRLSLGHWTTVGEQLVRINKMGLQLKFLSLSLDLTEVTTECIRAVLQFQSNSLEHLILTCYYDVSVSERDNKVDPRWLFPGMEFPRMEKLKDLKVKSDNLYSRISYKNMFPVLKKLEVYDVFDRSYDKIAVNYSFFNESIEPVETVEFLRFGRELRSPETILQAARQFPKVRGISLIVRNNQFLNILGNALPWLEEMEIVFYRSNSDMDLILTGLSSEEVDALKALSEDQLDEVERSKEPVHFLKNLKRLRLSSLHYRTSDSSLSDFGCRFALLKMDHLQVLELDGNFSQISDQVMERMREKFIVRLENSEN